MSRERLYFFCMWYFSIIYSQSLGLCAIGWQWVNCIELVWVKTDKSLATVPQVVLRFVKTLLLVMQGEDRSFLCWRGVRQEASQQVLHPRKFSVG